VILPRLVFLYNLDGRIDYATMMNAATKGTKTRKQRRRPRDQSLAVALYRPGNWQMRSTDPS
jgi:hypothetical protein